MTALQVKHFFGSMAISRTYKFVFVMFFYLYRAFNWPEFPGFDAWKSKMTRNWRIINLQ